MAAPKVMANQSKTTTPKKIAIRPHMFDSAESAGLWFDIFNGILFLGALLVTIGTWGTIKTAGIKEKFSDERISANEAETKRAIADSDIAKQGAAEANARALESKLALEKFKAPRLLSQTQIEVIAKKLPQIAMNSVAVSASPVTVETVALTEQIAKILSLAGYKPNINLSGNSVFFGVFTGVIVQYATGNDESTKLAEALAGALNDEQIETQLLGGLHESVYVPPYNMDRKATGSRNMLIAIGEKPK